MTDHESTTDSLSLRHHPSRFGLLRLNKVDGFRVMWDSDLWGLRWGLSEVDNVGECESAEFKCWKRFGEGRRFFLVRVKSEYDLNVHSTTTTQHKSPTMQTQLKQKTTSS